MYSEIFINTFLISSICCFVVDIIFPSSRVEKKSRKLILKDYQNSLVYVIPNLIISHYYFSTFENLIEDLPRNNFPITFNLTSWGLMADILFYYLHYLFHKPVLYYYHKIHHSYIYTYGITSLYAHPLDFVITNLVPASLPIYILRPQEYIIKNLIIFSTSYTVIISHGGYVFLPKSHLVHHTKKVYNYGLILTDKIWGTEYK